MRLLGTEVFAFSATTSIILEGVLQGGLRLAIGIAH